MVNKALFSSPREGAPRADAVNEAGGPAYAFSDRLALAHIAATGCFRGNYYADAEDQLAALLDRLQRIDDPLFLAKLAVYARERAYMKDMPAAILVQLSRRSPELFHQVFDRVVDDGRMLRTMFQMIRSGRLGRRSLSATLQRAFQRWLNAASDEKLLSASIGADPSLRDVLRTARPTPKSNARRALFGKLVGRDPKDWAPAGEQDLPELLVEVDRFRASSDPGEQAEILSRISVRWDLLAGHAKGLEAWKALARRMGPQALRMNLNTLARHGVFGDEYSGPDEETAEYVAGRFEDADEVRRGRQFPYQYFAAYLNADETVPPRVKASLAAAADVACGNTPRFPGPVLIGVDVSGSMSSGVLGFRGRGHSSTVRCVDVAALFASAVLRRNPGSVVVPFDTEVVPVELDLEGSILRLAEQMAAVGGGGTDCSVPLTAANTLYADRKFAGVVVLTDEESWVDDGCRYSVRDHGETGTTAEWRKFVLNQARLADNRGEHPKLVCVNLQPYTTTQIPEDPDVLNVGGFSDAVFSIVDSFLRGDSGGFLAEVEAVDLGGPDGGEAAETDVD